MFSFGSIGDGLGSSIQFSEGWQKQKTKKINVPSQRCRLVSIHSSLLYFPLCEMTSWYIFSMGLQSLCFMNISSIKKVVTTKTVNHALCSEQWSMDITCFSCNFYYDVYWFTAYLNDASRSFFFFSNVVLPV